jgi:putative membrane protein insertion efficiency factor
MQARFLCKFQEVRGFMEIIKKALIQSIRAYKRIISPMLPPSCRFTPSCSQYMVEAIEKYGVIKGALMGIWRLLRCQPFSKGGFDPVE